jgi:hypothetical protein
MLRKFILTLLCLLTTTSHLRANGAYMPQRAYPTMPTIPQQQAIIIHQNNTETLIVESAFQTESPEVAWILPLPAPPTNLELGEPGQISSALYAASPIIRHDLTSVTVLANFIFLGVLAITAVIILTRNPATRRSNIVALGVLALFLICLSSILLPSLGGHGRPSVTSDIGILSAHRLGNAEFTTLTAKSPAALSQWLKDRSLQPLNAQAESIVSDYIARNWCFVVGKLSVDPKSTNLPRPLIATFPTKDPVFPMKLTALANSATRVELLLIADGQATAKSFHRAVTTKLERLSPERAELNGRGHSGAYRSTSSPLSLGSPDLYPRLWHNCILTKLTADLTPATMQQDVLLTLQPFTAPHHDIAYTYLSRGHITYATAVIGLSIWLILLAAIARGRRKPTRNEFRFLLTTFIILLLTTATVWISIQTIPVHIDHLRGYRSDRMQKFFEAAEVLRTAGIIRPDMTPEEIVAVPDQMRAQNLVDPEYLLNPYTRQPIRPERSPGNFAIRNLNDQLSFCLYMVDGTEYYTPLTPPPPRKK